MRSLLPLGLLLLAAIVLCAGCATMPYDYSAYSTHPPRSILVLPPLNHSVAVDAPYIYLSTITRPLAEHGYYVFPVAVVDAFMKDNGLADPAQMQAVPLKKLGDIIGPDAVLYTTINEWGQKYHIVSSDTTVDISARLVDTQSGTLLWKGSARAVVGSSNGQGGLLAQAIVAAVQQIANTVEDRTPQVARIANNRMIDDPDTGLPYGPYNPEAATDSRRQ